MATMDRLLDPQFVRDLGDLAVEVLRERRQQCRDVEESLSYFRRLVQGRLDIVHAELRRREGGNGAAAAPALAELVEQLPEILSGELAPARGMLIDAVAPPDAGDIAAEIDAVLGPEQFAALPELPDSALQAAAEQLTVLEHDVSAQRRRLHETIDTLQAEIVNRYKTGEATVDALLA
jgi:hypothetical protein